jgi:hypothetical protein
MAVGKVEILRGASGSGRVAGVRAGRLGAVAAVLLAVAIACWPSSAGAARHLTAGTPLRSDPHLLQIVSPRHGARLHGQVVTVRARVRPGVKLLSARLGEVDVGGRFVRRAHGRLLVARLRLGQVRGLHRGRDRLVIMVGKGRRGDAEVVPFGLVRRDPGLPRLRAPRRTARAVRVKLRLARADARVTVWLNGRRLRLPAGANDDRRTRTIGFSGDEGLRHGRNALRVKAVDPRGGRVAVRRRSVFVERTAPIAGAGLDRRVSLGHGVRLDAGDSEAARAPKSLRYHWRIVRKPRGSRAKLLRADARRPRFKPDLPGDYRLRMTVTERMPAVGVGRGRAGTRELAETFSTTAANDTTTVEAQPEGAAGLGIALDTIEEAPGGAAAVKVGNNSYLPPEPADPLQLVVLDRGSLELKSNRSFTASTEGTAQLAAAVAAAGSETIVIVTTPTRGAYPAAEGTAALANLNRAITSIGAAAIPADVAVSGGYCGSSNGVCGSFSAVGTPGSPAGSGTVNPGLASPDGPGGDLRGYLELDQTNTLFSFVQEEHVHFDTTAAGTTSQRAVIEVGEGPGAAVYSGELSAPQEGAYVLVLDAGSLDFREDASFALQFAEPAAIAANLGKMATMLERYEDDPSALVFIQSIGTMVRWEAYEGDESLPKAWNRLAGVIEKLGGQRTIFNAMEGGAPNYAQVGPGDDPDGEWAKVASPAAGRTAGQLAGTLARNATGQLFPQNAGATDEYEDELTMLAYRRPEPWPMHETAGQIAAQRCIAAELGLSYPIEANYTNPVINWSGHQVEMTGLAYKELNPQHCETSEFTEAELREVVGQLSKEFTAVPEVWSLIEKLKAPFLYQGTSSALNIAMVGENVEQAISPPNVPVRYDGGEIAEEILYAIGALPGVGEASNALELLAAGIGLVEATTLNAEGTPALKTPISSDAKSVALELADQYKTAALHFSQIGEMLVGDWSKLQAVAANVQGPWAWNSAREARAVEGLNFASRRFAYLALFPKAFGGLLRGVRGESGLEVPTDPSRYPCWNWGRDSHGTFYPFGKAAEFGGVAPVVEAGGPATGDTVREDWVFAQPTGPNEGNSDEGPLVYPSFSPSVPSGDLMKKMFGEDAPETSIPPLQPLEFVLAIRDQLQVLTVRHATYEYGTGGEEPNTCEGQVGGWPWGS